MKYTATFPATAGQWAGSHWFATKAARVNFVARAKLRGADISEVVFTEKTTKKKVPA